MTPQERDAGIRADIARGVLTDTEIAERWGVHRSSVFYKRVPRWQRVAASRKFVPTRRGSNPTMPEPTPPKTPLKKAVAVKKWVPYNEYVTQRPAPEPGLPLHTTVSEPTPEERTGVKLTNSEAGRAVRALEALGWRAESVSIGDNLSSVEVRDMSVRHMPLLAKLKSQQEVDDFISEHGQCPPRGKPIPAHIPPNGTSKRAPSDPGAWLQVSLSFATHTAKHQAD